MNGSELRDAVVVHLASLEPAGAVAPYAASTPGISEAVGVNETLADRVSLLSALASLKREGLVEETVTDVVGLTGERNAYDLTAAGRRRATTVREEFENQQIVVHDDEGTTTLRAGAVEETYPGVSLAESLARLTPDGELHLESDVGPAFVDRDRELARLTRAFEDALSDELRVVFVSGDAGVGKTALVERLLDDVRERGGIVFVGSCRREGGEPYQPITEALSVELDASTDFENPGPSVDDSAMYEAQRAALFDRVASSVTERAGDRPLVLFVDDLQWADQGTLQLLAAVVGAVEDLPVTIVGAYRPTPLEDDRSPWSVVTDDVDDERRVHVSLEPLPRSAVGTLVERVVGHRGVPSSFVDAVFDRTGGTPLFVVESVAQMIEDGTIEPSSGHYPDDAGAVSLPDAVRTVIRRRLAPLDEETRSVLECASVAGPTVDFDLLAAVCEVPVPHLRERVDLLVGGGILEADGDRVRFANDVVRTTVLEDVDPERRRRIHGRVGDATVEVYADDLANRHASVAHHYERAGRKPDAMDHYVRAADRARSVYAHEDAMDHYEAALALARDLDATDELLPILEAITDIHYIEADYETVDRYCRYTRERTDDPEAIRQTFRYQAQIRSDRGAYDEAIEYADRGLAVEEDAKSIECCRLLGYKGWALASQGHLDEAIDVCEAERDMAEALDAPLQVGQALRDLGNVEMYRGDLDGAVSDLQAAVDLIEANGGDLELSRCLSTLGTTYLQADDLDAGREALERSLAIATDIGDQEGRLQTLNNLGMIHAWNGEWEAALAYHRDQFEAATRMGDQRDVGYAHANTAAVYVETRDLSTAREKLERSVVIARETNNQYNVAYRLTRLARVLLLQDDLDAAHERASEALDIACEHEFKTEEAAALRVLGTVAREQGDLDTAIERHEAGVDVATAVGSVEREVENRCALAVTLCRADRPADGHDQAFAARDAVPEDGYRVLAVRATVTLGTCDRAIGDTDAADEHLRAGLEAARDLSNPLTCVALLELGGLQEERGDRQGARERVEEALGLADSIGAELYARTCRDRLSVLSDQPH